MQRVAPSAFQTPRSKTIDAHLCCLCTLLLIIGVMKVSGSKRISSKVSFSALWPNTFIACTIKTNRFNLKLNNASVPACAGIIRSSNIWCCFRGCSGGSCRINNVNAENWLKPNKFARYVIQYLPALIVKSQL